MASLKYFTGLEAIDELRKKFRHWCLILHPDKGGSKADFVSMKDEYDALIKYASIKEGADAFAGNRDKRYTYESETALARMIELLLTIPEITIEICGAWLWISGNTFKSHTRLYDIGCKFSKTKRSWYWFATIDQQGKRRGRYSMSKIRAKFGSQSISGNQAEKEPTPELRYA